MLVSPGVCAAKALVDHVGFNLLQFGNVSQGKHRRQVAELGSSGHMQRPRGERGKVVETLCTSGSQRFGEETVKCIGFCIR